MVLQHFFLIYSHITNNDIITFTLYSNFDNQIFVTLFPHTPSVTNLTLTEKEYRYQKQQINHQNKLFFRTIEMQRRNDIVRLLRQKFAQEFNLSQSEAAHQVSLLKFLFWFVWKSDVLIKLKNEHKCSVSRRLKSYQIKKYIFLFITKVSQ